MGVFSFLLVRFFLGGIPSAMRQLMIRYPWFSTSRHLANVYDIVFRTYSTQTLHLQKYKRAFLFLMVMQLNVTNLQGTHLAPDGSYVQEVLAKSSWKSITPS